MKAFGCVERSRTVLLCLMRAEPFPISHAMCSDVGNRTLFLRVNSSLLAIELHLNVADWENYDIST